MLDSSVLVLNRNWQPIHVTTVRRAFTLLYMGAAHVIGPDFALFDFESWSALAAAEGEGVIRTVHQVIRAPQVIMLQLYDRIPRARVRFSRLNIYARDQNQCQYCGARGSQTQLNLDHVVPRSRGGRTTWENVVCCCVPCNLRKAARTPQEAGMRLLKPPISPRWTPTFRARGTPPSAWLPFLGTASASYWNTELLDEHDG